MELTPHEAKPALMRLKRAKGQIEAAIRMLEEGADCQDAVMQISAASKATSRAGMVLVTTGMRRCFERPGPEASADQDRLEKIMLSLS